MDPLQLPSPPTTEQLETSIIPTDPYEEEDGGLDFLEFQALLSKFRVNWKKGKPYNTLRSLKMRAKALSWSPIHLEMIERINALYSRIPRICPGKSTKTFKPGVYSGGLDVEASCPCAKIYGFDPDVWKGIACPHEALLVFNKLASLVRELGIQPSDTVDLDMVIEIIKTHILESRLDEDVEEKGMFDRKWGGMIPTTKEAFWERKQSPSLDIKNQLLDRRNKIYDKLVASREAKNKKKAQESESQAHMDFSNLISSRITKKREIIEHAPDPEDIIEAEYSE